MITISNPPKFSFCGVELVPTAKVKKLQLICKLYGKVLPWEDADSAPVYWQATCECGNETQVEESKIVTGKVTSCFDCEKKRHGNSKRNVVIDFDGELKAGVKLGKLVILAELDEVEGKGKMYRVQCECGNTEKYSLKQLMLSRRPLRSCVSCIGKQ